MIIISISLVLKLEPRVNFVLLFVILVNIYHKQFQTNLCNLKLLFIIIKFR